MPPNIPSSSTTGTTTTTTTTSSSNNNTWLIENVQVVNSNLSSSKKEGASSIQTGIGFLDHMLDQFHSHAQIGVTITVVDDNNKNLENDRKNRNETSNQEELFELIGSAIGKELFKILPKVKDDDGISLSSRFCSPLDEALVECILERTSSTSQQQGKGSLATYKLAPFGTFGKNGRTFIGSMKTSALESFFQAFALESGLILHLNKIRGENGHHIVESTFKALSRALRNLLDGTNTTSTTDEDGSTTYSTWMSKVWGNDTVSSSSPSSLVLSHPRTGTVERKTKETSIAVHLQLDPATTTTTPSIIDISTGIPLLNDILVEFAKAAQIAKLVIHCKGDLYIDDHHTTEDIGIALGQVLKQSFGTKAGFNRMWTCRRRQYCYCSEEEESNNNNNTVEVTMDLSNRPCLTSNLQLHTQEYVKEKQDLLTTEMMHHFIESLVINAGMTVHIVEQENQDATTNDESSTVLMLNRIQTCMKAFGTCLLMCCAIDPRRAGQTASSKGTLSV